MLFVPRHLASLTPVTYFATRDSEQPILLFFPILQTAAVEVALSYLCHPCSLEQGGFCIDEVYVHKKKSPFISMPFINFSVFHSNTRTLGFGTAGG
jgi:hypothetical protein